LIRRGDEVFVEDRVGCQTSTGQTLEQIRLHRATVQTIDELSEVAFPRLRFRLRRGSQQEPFEVGQGHMHPRKKAMTGCGIGSSAQRRVPLDPSFPPLLRIAVRHGLANLLSHQPGGRIADFDLSAQLRDSLLVLTHAIERPEPTPQRDPCPVPGLVKDRPGGHRTLISARPALVDPLGAQVASAVSSTAGADKTLRPALGGQILPALLLAAKQRQEILNGKNVFSFQRLRRFIRGRTISSFVRLTNIDIYYFFCGNEAVMYKKTSHISIFSCITKP
jgi:hypothetical protein